MKDLDMTELSNKEFRAAKAKLDMALSAVDVIAAAAKDAMAACCSGDTLDQRDQFAHLAGYLRAAESALLHARAVAGGINGAGITRSGGT